MSTVIVTGASGLVGSALVPFLGAAGHTVRTLVRRAPRSASEVRWDPVASALDPAVLDDVDVAVHLAGENVADGRWTEKRRRELRESRTVPTTRLAEALARASRRPRVLVSASAIGFYGDRGEEDLTEESTSGDGFLAELTRDWEAAAGPARDAGVRVVHLRIGLVVSAHGGALARMLTPFRMGVGGRLGSGTQWMSWIALHDLLRVVAHAMERPQLAGPVNTVSPEPVRNEEFTGVLGRVLHRPTIVPAPAFALRVAFGEMADEMLVSSAKVVPRRLVADGFAFRFPRLEDALRHTIDGGGE